MGFQGASVLSEFPPRDIIKVSYTSSIWPHTLVAVGAIWVFRVRVYFQSSRLEINNCSGERKRGEGGAER